MTVPYKSVVLDRTLRLYGNGKLPDSVLKPVHCGGTMYGPAAWWFNVMFEEAKKAGITLKATVLFTHPTLEALVDHLLAGLPAALAEAAPAEAASAASDGEDIAALLRLALQSRSTST